MPQPCQNPQLPWLTLEPLSQGSGPTQTFLHLFEFLLPPATWRGTASLELRQKAAARQMTMVASQLDKLKISLDMCQAAKKQKQSCDLLQYACRVVLASFLDLP